MDYLEYAYLQSGRVTKAKAVLDDMNSLPPVGGLTLTNDYAVAAIPARYALELGNWKEASELRVRRDAVDLTQAISWAAIGVGSARSGNLERAAQAEQTLASLRDTVAKENNVYWSNQVEVQRREVAGWIAEKGGKAGDAITIMRSAADLEESMDKNAVTPGAVIPAREMLAELLLNQSQLGSSALVDCDATQHKAASYFLRDKVHDHAIAVRELQILIDPGLRLRGKLGRKLTGGQHHLMIAILQVITVRIDVIELVIEA